MDSKQRLVCKHEGVVLKMYQDSRGIPTIGIGHNLRDVPISQAAAYQIFEDDSTKAWGELVNALPWVASITDAARQAVLFDLAYNLGILSLLSFQTFLKYMQAGQWLEAAQDLSGTLWARQVPQRARDNIELIQLGVASPLWGSLSSQA